jgi:hypothetical protein
MHKPLLLHTKNQNHVRQETLARALIYIHTDTPVHLMPYIYTCICHVPIEYVHVGKQRALGSMKSTVMFRTYFLETL